MGGRSRVALLGILLVVAGAGSARGDDDSTSSLMPVDGGGTRLSDGGARKLLGPDVDKIIL